jgi:hypothetical protein
VGVRLLGERFKIWTVIVVIIQLTWHIGRNSTELQVCTQGNNKWGLPRGPHVVFGEGFLVLERSVLVQCQCLGPQKKAYLVNYRMQAIFRVLKFQNWDPEGSGGLTELKKTSQTCFWPNVCVIKETFKNLLPLGENRYCQYFVRYKPYSMFNLKIIKHNLRLPSI